MRRQLKHGVLHFFCRRLKLGFRGRKRSVLPRELWEKIYKRLPASDRIRFASVKKDWISIAAAKPPPPPVLDPWLMFHGMNTFWSPLQKRFYMFNSTIPPKKEHKILGASNGWLLITEHPGLQVQKSLILVNPISNAKIILPPIEYSQIRDLKKLLVVTFGDSVVPAGVFVRTHGNYLLACACDNRPWIYFSGGYSDDVLFYNGKLYNLMVRRLKTTNTIVITARSLNEQLEPHGEHTYTVEHMSTSSNGLLEVYLVGSCGDILLVKRFRHPKRFEVYKLLLLDEERSARCVKLESSEGQALFWGRDGCISLPAGKFSLFEENHIYFSVQGRDRPYKLGVYSLKDMSFKDMQNLPQKSFQQESTWFSPNIKDTFINMDTVNSKGTKSLRAKAIE